MKIGEIIEKIKSILSENIDDKQKVFNIDGIISEFKENERCQGPFFLVNLTMIHDMFYDHMDEIEESIEHERAYKSNSQKFRYDPYAPEPPTVLFTSIAVEIEEKSYEKYPSILDAIKSLEIPKKELIKQIKKEL